MGISLHNACLVLHHRLSTERRSYDDRICLSDPSAQMEDFEIHGGIVCRDRAADDWDTILRIAHDHHSGVLCLFVLEHLSDDASFMGSDHHADRRACGLFVSDPNAGLCHFGRAGYLSICPDDAIAAAADPKLDEKSRAARAVAGAQTSVLYRRVCVDPASAALYSDC